MCRTQRNLAAARRFACLTTLSLLISINAYAADSHFRLTASCEAMRDGNAATIGALAWFDIGYVGLSLNRIDSSRPIQWGDRKTIYPIYLYLGVKAPWRIAPYAELGIDLAEAMIDDLLDETAEGKSRTDTYLAGGLTFTYQDKLSLSLYAKQYNFIYQERSASPAITNRQSGLGARLSYAF